MSVGFEAFNPDGSSLISSVEGVARLIYSVDVSPTFSGTFSLPNFDSDLGVWNIQPYIYRWLRLGGVFREVADNETFLQSGNPVGHLVGWRNPVVSWDNYTKLFTVTVNSEPRQVLDGVSSSIVLDKNPRTRIAFLHYR